MKLIKKGLIYCPENLSGWRDNTFMTPAPILKNDREIRIYGGFRDKSGVSRIGYIDVASDDPKKIIRVSENPVLGIGADGTFDDNGVILGSVLSHTGKHWMYYVGFQLVAKAKFLAYSGLAISKDQGDSFERVQETPIMDRYKEEKFVRAIHSVIYDEGKFKIWYSTGRGWEYINGIPYPQYKIMYTESVDGINIPLREGIDCIDVIEDEYRVGRPTVYKEDGIFKMFYTKDTLSKIYSPGYAESTDGINWERKEYLFPLKPSETGWDSEMISYPVPLKTKNNHYIFYSGNGMGRSGVGYAEIIDNKHP